MKRKTLTKKDQALMRAVLRQQRKNEADIYRRAAQGIANGNDLYSCIAISTACGGQSYVKALRLRERYGALFSRDGEAFVTPMQFVPLGHSINERSQTLRQMCLLFMAAMTERP